MKEFLLEWINWYYGMVKYPLKLQNQMTYNEKIEAISKTQQLKKIMDCQK